MNKLSEQDKRDVRGWLVAYAVAVPLGIIVYHVFRALLPDGPLTWTQILEWLQ